MEIDRLSLLAEIIYLREKNILLSSIIANINIKEENDGKIK
jgi:hypothetical protein